ncbi:hypothetical protein HOLleu_40755 [Holothuria leucospilota]|uniref:Uncharacterized protein n=1 Tax=Holothuria leucospilota TaxID=206669 RepID=A0A9Q1BBW3_HOLLE|nr:hypothetical protein HOLleu_40755 [Holothuria leucospilota]
MSKVYTLNLAIDNCFSLTTQVRVNRPRGCSLVTLINLLINLREMSIQSLKERKLASLD